MQLVITYKKHASTTSLLVAEKFGKRHDDVLRSIRNLECSDDFRLRNFTESNYPNRGKDYPMFIISRDGFTLLMMAFSGPRAAGFREEFIDEFNRMEAILRQGAPPVLLATYQKRILSQPTKQVPEGYWSIFDESHTIMLFVETYIGSVNEFDLVDGSIGSFWARYRKGQPWATGSKKYPHQYNDVRGERDCHCYPDAELPHFRKWLKNTYRTMHLPNYLVNKYTKEKNVVMLDKVNELLPKLLGK